MNCLEKINPELTLLQTLLPTVASTRGNDLQPRTGRDLPPAAAPEPITGASVGSAAWLVGFPVCFLVSNI